MGWEQWAAVLLIGLGFAVAWHAAKDSPAAARLGLVALWALLSFMRFKAGFVRQTQSHSNVFFASLLGGAGRLRLGAASPADGLVLGAMFALAMFSVVAQVSPRDLVQPGQSRASAYVEQAPHAGRAGGGPHGAIT